MESGVEIPDIIVKNGIIKKFPKGSKIYRVNSEITHCYLILSGMGKIYIDHNNGRRSILDFVVASDWLGELSIFSDEAYIKENKVLEDMSCIEIELALLKSLCKEIPEVSFYFASYISNKLLARTYRMSEGLNYSLTNRLAGFILDYENNDTYQISHIDASEYLNVSYRHVLQVMKDFREEGILEKSLGKGYDILNRQKLLDLR